MTMRVVLAIDDSPHARAATKSIIDHVRPDATTVHVLHVIELDRMLPPAVDFARGADYGAEVVARVDHSRDAAERLVASAAQQLHQAHFLTATAVAEGDPRHAILNYATEIGCHCIVMGSHGRRGFDRFFMGSVSESVVRHAHCSVVLIRLDRTDGHTVR